MGDEIDVVKKIDREAKRLKTTDLYDANINTQLMFRVAMVTEQRINICFVWSKVVEISNFVKT